MDVSKLIMAGHSFGAMTAISVAQKDSRIAACVTLDPWLYVYEKEIMENNYGLNIPFFVTTSEHFHPYLEFDSQATFNKILNNCTDSRIENIIMLTTGHLH